MTQTWNNDNMNHQTQASPNSHKGEDDSRHFLHHSYRKPHGHVVDEEPSEKEDVEHMMAPGVAQENGKRDDTHDNM